MNDFTTLPRLLDEAGITPTGLIQALEDPSRRPQLVRLCQESAARFVLGPNPRRDGVEAIIREVFGGPNHEHPDRDEVAAFTMRVARYSNPRRLEELLKPLSDQQLYVIAKHSGLYGAPVSQAFLARELGLGDTTIGHRIQAGFKRLRSVRAEEERQRAISSRGGLRMQDPIELAGFPQHLIKALENRFSSLSELAELSDAELAEIPGVGKKSISKIKAVTAQL